MALLENMKKIKIIGLKVNSCQFRSLHRGISFLFVCMKFTCLSKGRGFHFPPCHILNICGFRVLLDCPLDLSALTIFSPIPVDSYVIPDEDTSDRSDSVGQKRQKIDKSLNASSLIHAEPCYRTVKNLHLYNVSSIDVVLISSPMGMLGLPFLTRNKGFCAKIYVTEATARLGQLMMEDLVTMHMEFRRFYGPEDSGFPQWMKWGNLDVLPSALKDIALGSNGVELGGWMSLYSAADAKDCMQKVHALRYAEETCYNGTLIIKAFSSGLELGTCNWTISGPKRNITCLSSSVFVSAHAMSFDFHALRGSDLILYSDFSFLNSMEDVEDDNCSAPATNNFSTLSGSDKKDDWEEITESLLNPDESLEEMEKLTFICSCAMDSVKAGGSVLIPIGRPGIFLQLLEQMSFSLESLTLKVPIFMISSVAEELLAFSNTIPEWLCKLRQEKLYSGEPLFAHVELIKEKKLHTFPAVFSHKLLTIWQEPCIVFCPHWSLRLGPVVHFLRRWCGDCNSLLVMEEGVDADLALLPFKPMAMKVLQCSFLSGIKLHKVEPLLKILQPKFVLFPENLKRYFGSSSARAFSFIHYCENKLLHIPSLKDSSDLDIATDLASQLHWTNSKQKNTNIARLKGELLMEHSKHRLLPGNEQLTSSQTRPLLHWGTLDLDSLLTALQKMGINGSVERCMGGVESENVSIVRVIEPNKALIEINATSTVISTSDENLATLISQAICLSLNGI